MSFKSITPLLPRMMMSLIFILLLLSSCTTRREETPLPATPTITATSAQGESADGTDIVLPTQGEAPIFPYPEPGTGSDQPGGQGSAYPGPYPGGAGQSFSEAYPGPDQQPVIPTPVLETPTSVQRLPDGSYPPPPTPENPWRPRPTESDAESTSDPRLTAEPSSPVPTSSPTSQPDGPTQTPTPLSPIPTLAPPTPTLPPPTPTPLPPTPTPLPTRIPVSSRIVATDPEIVELASGMPQLIEFFAYWDGYSKSMAPIIHGLEAKYSTEMNFIYLDIDNPDTKELKLALGYELRPHFFLLDEEGKILEQWIGLVDESELEAAILSAIE